MRFRPFVQRFTRHATEKTPRAICCGKEVSRRKAFASLPPKLEVTGAPVQIPGRATLSRREKLENTISTIRDTALVPSEKAVIDEQK